jgi:hypothetical protein
MVEIDEFKEKTGMTLHEQYMMYHPQILSDFEDEMPRIWGKKWKANTLIGKLRTFYTGRGRSSLVWESPRHGLLTTQASQLGG